MKKGAAVGDAAALLVLSLLAGRPLAAAPAGAAPGKGKVTLDDIESRLRQIGGSATQSVAKSAPGLAAVGVVGGAAVVALAYLYGRRRGRRRATVLEIRRV